MNGDVGLALLAGLTGGAAEALPGALAHRERARKEEELRLRRANALRRLRDPGFTSRFSTTDPSSLYPALLDFSGMADEGGIDPAVSSAIIRSLVPAEANLRRADAAVTAANRPRAGATPRPLNRLQERQRAGQLASAERTRQGKPALTGEQVTANELEFLARSGQVDPSTGKPAWPGLAEYTRGLDTVRHNPEAAKRWAEAELAQRQYATYPDADLVEEYLRRVIQDAGVPGRLWGRNRAGGQGLLQP